ncbi:anhydro-N-acetylmuramic acid kinase [Ahrensia sp. R2A130]|uniref:anhydro-N-acetylmuramic acid kinase n=1 Tax=Ahrensia sp. R2A130 TaxID=744979 RepID=UPI0001E0AC5C|nr:anhydro-N-acetylmuramic acid kinase [Ahrensia sp. R2A130]EFL90120.1 anhydro-N-acetylmuramic acid kinase [Ahrensia sp. R2A130]
MKTAIGLMSGTSMDGIDAALVRTDGRNAVQMGVAIERPYSPATRKRIEAALEDAKVIQHRDERPAVIAELEVELTELHVDATFHLLEKAKLHPSEVDLLGFHGQTVLHRPDVALTVQIGDGQALADVTGIDTVFDMRAADMESGGQGAPLVPVFHQALAFGLKLDEPVAFVNIGGISNISYVDGDDLIAFDCGPGNALIDQWVHNGAGVPFDQGGAIASEGGVVASVVERYMASPYFELDSPKSLDRLDFAALETSAAGLHDGARTLAHVTAKAIYRSVDHLPKRPKTWILCGGGRLNPSIVGDLSAMADHDGATVQLADKLGLDGDMLEAQAFAYLAVRSVEGLPLTFPETTGCAEPTTGGVLARHLKSPVQPEDEN